MSKFDLIFIRSMKVVGAVLGSGIMIYETGWERADRPYLYAVATMMMGLQIAESVDKVVTAIGKLRSPAAPPTPTPTPEKKEAP